MSDRKHGEIEAAASMQVFDEMMRNAPKSNDVMLDDFEQMLNGNPTNSRSNPNVLTAPGANDMRATAASMQTFYNMMEPRGDTGTTGAPNAMGSFLLNNRQANMSIDGQTN